MSDIVYAAWEAAEVVGEEPTSHLRWKNSVLEQKWERRVYSPTPSIAHDWRPVPMTNDTPAPKVTVDENCGCDGALDPDGCEKCTTATSAQSKPSDAILALLDRSAEHSWDVFVGSLSVNDIDRLRAALPPDPAPNAVTAGQGVEVKPLGRKALTDALNEKLVDVNTKAYGPSRVCWRFLRTNEIVDVVEAFFSSTPAPKESE